MKKILLLSVIAFMAISSFSQDFENKFYFRVGYSNPSWSYFDMDKDTWGDGFSKYGANFELGSLFMIPSILNSDVVSLGINVDYLYASANNFHFEDEYGPINIPSYRVGSKIGPSLTYVPMKNMALDFYVKADIAWASVVAPFFEKFDDGDDYYRDYLPVGFSTGINFRYGLLILGVEFNTISPKLESDDYPDTYFQEYIDFAMEKENSSDKSKMPNLNFTIGLNF